MNGQTPPEDQQPLSAERVKQLVRDRDLETLVRFARGPVIDVLAEQGIKRIVEIFSGSAMGSHFSFDQLRYFDDRHNLLHETLPVNLARVSGERFRYEAVANLRMILSDWEKADFLKAVTSMPQSILGHDGVWIQTGIRGDEAYVAFEYRPSEVVPTPQG